MRSPEDVRARWHADESETLFGVIPTSRSGVVRPCSLTNSARMAASSPCVSETAGIAAKTKSASNSVAAWLGERGGLGIGSKSTAGVCIGATKSIDPTHAGGNMVLPVFVWESGGWGCRGPNSPDNPMMPPREEISANASTIPVEWQPIVGSTQTWAREAIARGLTEPSAFAAGEQTKGYGRDGRVWQSPAGGLWMTVALPGVDPTTASLRAAAAVGRVLEAVLGGEPRIHVKWPNDLLIGEAKVCGILCEGLTHEGRPWLLIGVGINVNNPRQSLTSHLRRPAAALVEFTTAPIDLTAFGEQVANAIARAFNRPDHAEELRWIAPRLWRANQRVRARFGDGSHLDGVLRGLNDAGLPIIEHAGEQNCSPGIVELADIAD